MSQTVFVWGRAEDSAGKVVRVKFRVEVDDREGGICELRGLFKDACRRSGYVPIEVEDWFWP